MDGCAWVEVCSPRVLWILILGHFRIVLTRIGPLNQKLSLYTSTVTRIVRYSISLP